MADTGFKNPSAYDDDYADFTNPARAYTENSSYSTSVDSSDEQDWYNFDFSSLLPGYGDTTIDGIEVTVNYSASSSGGTGTFLTVEISHDGGTTYSAEAVEQNVIGTTDVTKTWGGAADTWGRAWDVSETSDANFRVKLQDTGDPTDKAAWVDHIQVKIYYTLTTSASPSISPSVSLSPSLSQSLSQSLSPSLSQSLSPSISPSFSPSLSPSFSQSLSPSISPSISPSVSLSPSLSQSLSASVSSSVSPSASLSPSLSQSLSQSLSPSISPSASPSTSLSPSISVSVSPSVASPHHGAPLFRSLLVFPHQSHHQLQFHQVFL